MSRRRSESNCHSFVSRGGSSIWSGSCQLGADRWLAQDQIFGQNIDLYRQSTYFMLHAENAEAKSRQWPDDVWFPNMASAGTSWFKAKRDSAARLGQREEAFPDDIRLHIWTDKADEWRAKEPFQEPNVNMHGAVFSICLWLAWPWGPPESRTGQRRTLKLTPLKAKYRGLRIASQSEEDSWEVQIWATRTLRPQQTSLQMCLSQHELHFFRSLASLSCPLRIFWNGRKKSDCPASWHFFVAQFYSVFWNYFQTCTSLSEALTGWFIGGTILTQGSLFSFR